MFVFENDTDSNIFEVFKENKIDSVVHLAGLKAEPEAKMYRYAKMAPKILI